MPSNLWDRFAGERRRLLYERWVRDFSGELYGMAYRLCGDRETAEDLVQETFYHAWKGMRKLRDHGKARSWLYTILRFRHAHLLRRQTRRIRATASVDGLLERAEDGAPSPLAQLSDRDAIQTALDGLDETLKAPVLMVFIQGLTCRETAEALDIPLGTVLSRIHRARQRLRSALDDDDQAASRRSADEGDTSPGRRLRLRGGS